MAWIIVEPIASNMVTVPPRECYLEWLRSLCTGEVIILIFDELMTGFRVAHGGAQELYGVTPDMITPGRMSIIGGAFLYAPSAAGKSSWRNPP